MDEVLRNLGLVLLTVTVVAGALALLLLVIIAVQIRRIHVPPGADFAETLLYTPLLVALFLDLLDLSLDFLAAPIAWVILDRIGLRALRGVAAIEAFIPFTQFIPTMTLAWFGVRLLGRERFMSSPLYRGDA